jgi:uncharacterized delta-60 repeat protein
LLQNTRKIAWGIHVASEWGFGKLARFPGIIFLTLTLSAHAAPGDLDPAFGVNGIATFRLGSAIHKPTSIATQPDGKYLVAFDAPGIYGHAGGIARFNIDHSPDPSWGANGVTGSRNPYTEPYGNSIAAITMQSGKVLALHNEGGLGSGGNLNGQYQWTFVARYTSDGQLDTTFGAGSYGITTPFPAGGFDTSQRYSAIAVAPDGNIVVAGESSGSLLVVRFSATGILDTTFGTGGWTRIAIGAFGAAGTGIAVQPDGKIVVVGNHNASQSAFVVRLSNGGTLDPSFNGTGIYAIPNTNGPTDCRSVLLVGNRIVLGCTQTSSGTKDFLLFGLTSAGATDAGFDNSLKDAGGIDDQLYALTRHPDGRIFAAGRGGAGSDRIAVIAVNANGTLDSGFGNNGLYTAPESTATEARAIGWNGSELVVAGKPIVDTTGDALLATFTSAGVRTSLIYSNLSFSDGRYRRVKVLPDGKILAAGATTLNGISNFVVSRLASNGALDTSFGTAGHSTVSMLDYEVYGLRDFALQSDGKIVMTGDAGRNVTTAQSVGIARMLANGGIDPTFNASGTPGQNYLSIPDSAPKNQEPYYLPAVGHAIRVQTDGKALVVARHIPASLTAPGFQSIVVRFNTDGSVDGSYGVSGVAKTAFNFASQSRALDIDAAGRAVVVAIGTGGIQFARFDTTGLLDPSFGVGGMATFALPVGYRLIAVPTKVLVLPGGRIVAIFSAESFLDNNGVNSVVGVMRLDANGALDTTFGDRGYGLIVAAPGQLQSTYASDAVVMPNGRITLLCLTYQTPPSGVTVATYAVARFLSNGTPDNSFGNAGLRYYPGLEQLNGIDAQSDGALLLAGTATVGGLRLGLVMKTVTEPVTSFNLLAVKSGKTHGSTGTFYLPIDTSAPLSGAITVEPRVVGAAHTLIFQFDGVINSVGNATSLDAQSASMGSAMAVPSGTDVVVTLTGVPDKRRTTISIMGINGSSTASVSLGFLVGDVDSSGSVDQADVVAIKSKSGLITDKSNFLFDLNSSGQIGASEVAAAKARRGTTLP